MMMKNLLKTSYLLLLLGIFCCSNDDNPLLPISGDFVYPLEIGNKWEYTITETLSNFRPAIPGVDDSTTTFTSTVEIVGIDTLLDSIEVHAFEERGTRGIYWITLYENQSDGMFLYSGPVTNTLPKTEAEERYFFYGPNLTSIPVPGVTIGIVKQFDRNTLRLTPLKVFPYPFEVGKQWLFQEITEPTAAISRAEKKIVGTDKVQVTAGEFRCFKIQWIFTGNNGIPIDYLEQFDFVSDRGLIKRATFRKDFLLIGGAFGDTYVVDRRIESQLKSTNVQAK
jgi:hypothetical protein